MKTRPFKQLDVFTDTAYLGNPLAVVLDGTDLSGADMQHFAQWTNLSETTFLLPPSAAGAAQGADYQVRIFTPGCELPFAGHPTLGSCQAWLQSGGKPQAGDFIVQECQVGLVRIRRDGTRLAFAAPALKRCVPGDAVVAEVAAALGLEMAHIAAAVLLDNGPVWLGLLLQDAACMPGLSPDHGQLKKLGLKVGVVHVEQSQNTSPLIARSNREARAFGPRASTATLNLGGVSVQVRAFAAAAGVNEDPVTGSLNASLAQWLIAEGLAPSRYTATQGTSLGRHGQVHIEQDASGQVWVGGDVVTCIEGSVTL